MLLFYKQYYIAGNGIRDAVVNMVAAVLGMIPEGLVLLTSVALTLGALTLTRKNTLVQELYCIETLARVDTLCLDKTGTITAGTMCVEQVQPYVEGMEIKAPEAENENISESTINGTANQAQKVPEMAAAEAQSEVSVVAAQLQIGVVMGTTEQLSAQDSQGNVNTDLAISGAQPELTMGEIERVMANMMSVLKDKNATADALHKRFSRRTDMPVDHCIPFSSDRKYSGVAFKTEGTYLMGAAQFLFPDGNENLIKQCAAYGKEGLRVLVLAHSPNLNRENELPEGLKPVALFMLTDIIRDNAPETLAFFKDQGVDLKVISGDDPVTVSAIAKKAGLENADKYIDATTITTPEDMERAVAECSVFGRVTPQQKKEMVLALQKQKHTVAMTGDGVNDVLALKEADCSVVMAEGSDAAKNIANVVLMDSNFAAMPEIVNQGRRVVNNIRTAASMFLIKTIFSVLLCLITIFWGDSYPFEPIQMSLISACAVGIPTFLLAQENNFNKIESGFLRYVFMNAFPAAVTITGCVFTIMLVCQNVYHSNVMLSTACFLVTGWNYMAALKTVYAPLSRYRKIIIYGMQFIFFFAAVCVQNLLALGSLEFGMIILVFILMTFSPVVIEVITEWCRSLYNKAHEKEKKGIISLFLEKVQK
jgi:cation-transporting ATPase E